MRKETEATTIGIVPGWQQWVSHHPQACRGRGEVATTTWRLRGLHRKGDLTGAVTLVTGGKKVSVRQPGKGGSHQRSPWTSHSSLPLVFFRCPHGEPKSREQGSLLGREAGGGESGSRGAGRAGEGPGIEIREARYPSSIVSTSNLCYGSLFLQNRPTFSAWRSRLFTLRLQPPSLLGELQGLPVIYLHNNSVR